MFVRNTAGFRIRDTVLTGDDLWDMHLPPLPAKARKRPAKRAPCRTSNSDQEVGNASDLEQAGSLMAANGAAMPKRRRAADTSAVARQQAAPRSAAARNAPAGCGRRAPVSAPAAVLQAPSLMQRGEDAHGEVGLKSVYACWIPARHLHVVCLIT